MDWTASGRIDSFEFEKVSVTNLAKSLGKLQGVVSGTLTFGYYTDLKVSGSLEVVNTNFVNNCLIRVWYTPTLNGKTEKIRLCTCFASTSNMRYENGQYSGTIELRSVLARHLDDKLHKNYTLPKKGSAVSYFKKMFAWLGGSYKISGIKDKKFSNSVVMTFGSTPMEVLQYIADFVGGEITVDTYGRTVLQKYITPSKKPVSYTLPSGAYSVTLPGYDIEDSSAGTPNRAAVKFTYTDSKNKEKTLFGLAAAAKTNAISKQKVGRYITETYEIDNMSPKTQAKINAVAASRLKTASSTTKTYTIECYYLPIHIGEVVRFKYGGLDIDGLVTSIDIDLSVGCKMIVSIRRVRKHV